MSILKVIPKPFQDKFCGSRARYPAFVAGIGTGKTMFAILRGMILSEKYPDNLGLVVRKEFTDLRDSTIKDFERYTGLIVGSNKEVRLPNNSVIMFRHGAEVNVLKNINLGWFFIEQAEEFETEEQFMFLRDRLRRADIGFRTGFITANTHGHNWIWKFWKMSGDPDYDLSEATTFDNADNLPEDFIRDLKKMEKEAPSHYRRYVLNSWEEDAEADVVIPRSLIEKCIDRVILRPYVKKIISCDPAEFGDDETVIYAWENERIIESKVFYQREPMSTAGEIVALANKHNASLIAIDTVGVGSGIASRLREIVGEKKEIFPIVSGSAANAPDKYINQRTEMWFYAREMIEKGEVSIPKEEGILIEQLSTPKYRMYSDSKRQLEKKENTKKRLGRSPDRADAWIYGLWALKHARDEVTHRESLIDGYKRDNEPEGSYMAA